MDSDILQLARQQAQRDRKMRDQGQLLVPPLPPPPPPLFLLSFLPGPVAGVLPSLPSSRPPTQFHGILIWGTRSFQMVSHVGCGSAAVAIEAVLPALPGIVYFQSNHDTYRGV